MIATLYSLEQQIRNLADKLSIDTTRPARSTPRTRKAKVHPTEDIETRLAETTDRFIYDLKVERLPIG